jgi:hypothetical protein
VRRAIFLALAFACGGAVSCSSLPKAGIAGYLYTHTREPLDVHFDGEPVFRERADRGASSIEHVVIPTTIYYARWDTNAISDVMQRGGLEEVYYADLETFSVLFGLWNQYTVYAYGRRAAK